MPTIQDFELSSPLYGANAVYAAELYAKFAKDPNSVSPEWRSFFQAFGEDAKNALSEITGPSWTRERSAVIGAVDKEELAAKAAKDKGKGAAPSADAVKAAAVDSIRALSLIRAYRVRGHLLANLDPLGIELPKPHPELDPAFYGFSESDYDRAIFMGGVMGLETSTIREIIGLLHRTYCSTLGVEYMHIQHPEQKAWIQERIEGAAGNFGISLDEKKYILKNLIEIESFEQFLQVKYPGTKRFSVQGGDTSIAGLQVAIENAARLGVEEMVLGMAHRGRMNVLTTVMGKPFVELLSIFQGNMDTPEGIETSGDVKYHLGVSTDRKLPDGRTVHLSLNANPSHLEAVNPVVMGRVRAKQDQRGDSDRSKVMAILIHGDAAFAGQGLVAEGLSLSELKGYRIGGTLHIIINNQIGFTTSPKNQRSSPYPSDVAKAVQAPIFHVNGDDPEAVAFACKLAVEYRQKFRGDVVVDVFCYRKYGHNESDEPAFTQPIMYAAIGKHELPAQIYAKRLVEGGSIPQSEVDGQFASYREMFEKEFEAAKSFKPNKADWLGGFWSGFAKPSGEHPDSDTGVDLKVLKEIGTALSAVPQGVDVNKKIVRQLEAKRQMIDTGQGIDWATGEALAFGSLLRENFPVRLSGQDCTRGTFSHRHSGLIDQTNEEKYLPLNHLGGEQAKYEVIDSNLSEYAILGFDYGYSQAEPKALVCWEGQFGDFSNGAQVIIDQFIASAEIKWLRMSGIVMLLPHGYEGQGPEHSSARLERYLQLCAQDNMQVANCTTPANYFHILRRQIKRNFRKPLIMMTPKSLLRHKLAVSSLDEMKSGTSFKTVIGETYKLAADDKVKRVVMCSGKVYYDLVEEREKRGISDVAVVRVEQFYPFPAVRLAAELKRYKNADFVWCQEEPKNMGAWTFLMPRIEEVLTGIRGAFTRPAYAGRAEAASPATGYMKVHNAEQMALIEEALTGSPVIEMKKRA